MRSDNTVEDSLPDGFGGLVKRRVLSVWLSIYHTWHPVGTLARTFLESLAIIPRPVFYFSYAVDVAWFAQESCKVKKCRRELRGGYGLAPDDFVVIAVIKWSEREDPMTLLDAVLQAGQEVPKIKLLLLGDGPLREKIYSHRAYASNRLVLPGYAKYSELPLYYGISDLFVHPARSEPYGVSVQEAMACGLPVLASDKVGAAVDFVEANITGDFFPVGDANYLASLLIAWAGRAMTDAVRDSVHRKAEEWSYIRSTQEFRRCHLAQHR